MFTTRAYHSESRAIEPQAQECMIATAIENVRGSSDDEPAKTTITSRRITKWLPLGGVLRARANTSRKREP